MDSFSPLRWIRWCQNEAGFRQVAATGPNGFHLSTDAVPVMPLTRPSRNSCCSDGQVSPDGAAALMAQTV